MNTRLRNTTITLLVGLGVQISPGLNQKLCAATFYPIQLTNPGNSRIEIHGISANGYAVTGNIETPGAATKALYWSPISGLVSIDIPPSPFTSTDGREISADGTVIVGAGNTPLGREAFLWHRACAEIEPLGDLPGAEVSSFGIGISGDGMVAVGIGKVAIGPNDYQAFHSSGGTLIGLPPLTTGARCEARSTNSDGSIVVGFSNLTASTTQTHAVIWTIDSLGQISTFDIGELPGGGVEARSHAINPGATSLSEAIVVGDSLSGSGGLEPFLWSNSGGMIGLGVPAGSSTGSAYGVSDTQVVVGTAYGSEVAAFIWTPETGSENLQTLLESEYSLTNELQGWSLTHAMDISQDGSTICGFGTDPNGNRSGWVVDLSEPVVIP